MKTDKYIVKWEYRHIPIHTYCDILENGQLPIASAEVCCYHKDHFCKDTGRKLSLARALKNSPLTKEERKDIWDAYRHMTKKDRW